MQKNQKPQTTNRQILYVNNEGYKEILIPTRQLTCIGQDPPHDHPHIFLQMGAASSILCTYCATRYGYDALLYKGQTNPAQCVYKQPSLLDQVNTDQDIVGTDVDK